MFLDIYIIVPPPPPQKKNLKYIITRTTKNEARQHYNATKKGTAVPLEAWSVLEGSRKLRLPDFMTTAQDSGKVVGLKHRPLLPPGNGSGTHFC